MRADAYRKMTAMVLETRSSEHAVSTRTKDSRLVAGRARAVSLSARSTTSTVYGHPPVD